MKKDWRENWEDYAKIDRKSLDAMPVSTLLEKVDSGKYGDYYNIWYSIAARGDLETAGWILFNVLNRDIDYLYRYHCATALLSLLKNTEFEAVQLSGENHNYKENLESISKSLRKKIGDRIDF